MLFKTVPVYNESTFALITLSPQLPQQLLLFTPQSKFAVAAPTLDFGQPTDIAGINQSEVIVTFSQGAVVHYGFDFDNQRLNFR